METYPVAEPPLHALKPNRCIADTLACGTAEEGNWIKLVLDPHDDVLCGQQWFN
jgi:hypothetical protein